MPEVLVVGAGLGGLRIAESLRGNGFTGGITVVGDEPHLPYTRPPLSKEALAHGIDVTELLFRRKPQVDDVTWLLGRAVTACDLTTRVARLADGTTLAFDGLAVASGLRPRRVPIPGPAQGRHVLRTAADAAELRAHLVPGARVVILGAGFVGCEVAATARTLGAEVTVVAIDEAPMIRPLGPDLAAAMRRRHEAHGVRFRLGHTVDAFDGDTAVRTALLSDGTALPADVVVEAVGSVTNLEWLVGNGLDLSDGLLTDASMQVRSTPTPVVAVGDVARHPNALFGDAPRRIEHWNIPTETGRRAGATLAALLDGREPDRGPFTGMPSFWSDQYDYRLQSFGLPDLATRIEVLDGDLEGPCIVGYLDDAGLVGVVGVDRTPALMEYRRRLAQRAD